MAVWKSWVLGGALVSSVVACADSEQPSEDDGSPVAIGGDAASDDDASSSDAGLGGSSDAGLGGSSDAGLGGEDVPSDSTVSNVDASSSTQCDGLSALVRDFKDSHADFEKYRGSSATKGLVDAKLGADHKPVFKASLGQVTSASTFNEWYNDTAGVNQAITIPPLVLSPMAGGGFEYDSSSFFPIDGMGFGDFNSTGHNFHFTTEIHTEFTYEGGEAFTFRGDDDLWIFVNDQLALDLGGLHPVLSDTIDFDAQAAQLGIVKGSTYSMDIFHAERRTTDSNFRITTNIKCFRDVALF